MTIKEKIDTWLEDARKDLAENYKKIEPYGIFSRDEDWGSLLEPKFEEENGRLHVKMLGPYYTYWLEHGRGPTKNPTPHVPTVREVVYRWIKKYNIQSKDPKYNQKTLAFFISRSIHKYGIKVPGKYNPGGILTSVITKDRVTELVKEVNFLFIVDFKSTIIKELK
jgi:hypothetical protein